MLSKLSKLTGSETAQFILWGVAFIGVSVLVGLGKVNSTMLEGLLFGLFGAMSFKGKPDA